MIHILSIAAVFIACLVVWFKVGSVCWLKRAVVLLVAGLAFTKAGRSVFFLFAVFILFTLFLIKRKNGIDA